MNILNKLMFQAGNGPYILQGSTNLVDWVPLSTNTASGHLHFTDINTPKYNQGFYRVSVP